MVDQLVEKIRDLYFNSSLTNKEIAEKLHIKSQQVDRLVSANDMPHQYREKYGFPRIFMTSVACGKTKLGFKTTEKALEFIFKATPEQLSERRGGKHFNVDHNSYKDAGALRKIPSYSVHHGLNFECPKSRLLFRNIYENPERAEIIIHRLLTGE